VFNYRSSEYTCERLEGESVGKIDKICKKKKLARENCRLTCDMCTISSAQNENDYSGQNGEDSGDDYFIDGYYDGQNGKYYEEGTDNYNNVGQNGEDSGDDYDYYSVQNGNDDNEGTDDENNRGQNGEDSGDDYGYSSV